MARESKGFHIRDGAALVWAQRAGLSVGLLSARIVGRDGASRGPAWASGSSCRASRTSSRATNGSCATQGRATDVVAYMGDDLLDLPVLAGRAFPPRRRMRRPRSARAWTGSVPPPGAAAPCANSSNSSFARSNVGTPSCRSTLLNRNGRLRHALHAARVARRPDRRQGMGALQAQGWPLDRSPPRARIARTTCSG